MDIWLERPISKESCRGWSLCEIKLNNSKMYISSGLYMHCTIQHRSFVEAKWVKSLYNVEHREIRREYCLVLQWLCRCTVNTQVLKHIDAQPTKWFMGLFCLFCFPSTIALIYCWYATPCPVMSHQTATILLLDKLQLGKMFLERMTIWCILIFKIEQINF